MKIVIYKSAKKSDAYLFVENKDGFSQVPDQLMDMMGKLEYVMSLNLAERNKLAQANPKEVIRMLTAQGYYLQLPPSIYHTI